MWKITPTFIWRKLVGNSRSRAAARRGHRLDIESLEQRLLLTIEIDWRMPARFGLDKDNNNIIDMPNTVAYANPAAQTFRVNLLSSSNLGALSSQIWTITGGGLAQPMQAFGRNPTVQLPEGTFTVALVANENGLPNQRVTKEILVNDILIVAIGDSMAAGEGNPEVEGALGSVKWADEGVGGGNRPHPEAHRSTLSHSAQAALDLENESPRSSVTYVNLAHTGAETIDVFLEAFHDQAAQLDEVRDVVGTRQIDALVISAGINDVTFGNILGGLIKRVPVLGAELGSGFEDIEAGFKDDLSELNARYRRIDTAIREKLNVREVFLVQYPDPLRDDEGELADNLFQAEVAAGLFTGAAAVTLVAPLFGPAIFTLAGIGSALLKIDQNEAQWAKGHVQDPMAAIQAKSSRLLGWGHVDGVYEAFRTHGYTADDSFFNSLAESLSQQGDIKGTIHPNGEGQAVIGNLLLADLRRPVAHIVFPRPTDATTFGSLRLDGRQSSDLDGTVTGHEWDFDFRDGVFTVDATAASVDMPFFGGLTPRIVALRVTDNQGNVSDIVKRSVSSSQLNLSQVPIAFLDAVGRLNVRGSNQNDTILIEPGAAGLVNVRFGTASAISFAKNEFDLVVVDALGGNDTITVTATGFSTSILGGAGNDTITGGSGRDTIEGGNGNDSIVGGSGGDTMNVLSGGNGNDTITGGQGNDVLIGDAGQDSLTGLGGNDSMLGGDGNDILNGNAGDDTMRGGLGNDSFFGGADNDLLVGDENNDTIDGGSGDDSLKGDNGNDQLFGKLGKDTLDGGFGSDLCEGGADNDVLLSNGETAPIQDFGDVVRAFADFVGNSILDIFVNNDAANAAVRFGEFLEEIGAPVTLDILNGGAGNDTMTGGNATDVLFGESGDDLLAGGTGIDLLFGGTNNDSLRGGRDFDVIFGGAGDDLERLEGQRGLFGIVASDPFNFVDLGTGEDGVVIEGTSGDDQIFVSRRIADEGLYLVVTINGQTMEQPLDGCETIFVQGGAGNDVIEMDATQGRTWKAVLIGGSGNDRLVGTDRGDVLVGGTGLDELIGGDLDVLYQGLGGQGLQDENLASLDFFRRLAKRSRDR